MITAETIAEALKGTEARYASGTGWYSNGHFAVRGEQWASAFGECDLKPNEEMQRDHNRGATRKVRP